MNSLEIWGHPRMDNSKKKRKEREEIDESKHRLLQSRKELTFNNSNIIGFNLRSAFLDPQHKSIAVSPDYNKK